MKRKTLSNAIMHIPISSLSKYPLDRLMELLGKAATELETARRTKEWLEFAVTLKHHNSAYTKRMYMHKGISIAHVRKYSSYKRPVKLTPYQMQYHHKSKMK